MNYYGVNDYRNYLSHHGVKGMKWGVRKTDRTAKKDAKEYARAKMFYGEGAGNRRKLIKATVDYRSKNVPGYKEAFDRHLSNQDMSKHASAAKKERKIRSGAKSTKRTVKGLVNSALHTGARVSASAATIYAVAHYTGLDKKVANYAKSSMTDVNNYIKNRKLINLQKAYAKGKFN